MQQTEDKSFGQPDETREFPHGLAEVLSVGDEPVVVIDWYGASNYAKPR